MRIVTERIIEAGGGGKSTDPAGATREYLDRVAKYIPAEIVAAYIAASGIAAQARSPRTLLTAIFAVCVVLTPVYVTRFTSTTKEAWVNASMAVAAFIVWAYATGVGLAHQLGWYDAPTASVVLILFTLASGAVVPTKQVQPANAKP